MRRHMLVAVVFSVLVLTAGCSGIIPGGETPTATSDESPTPDDTFDKYPSGFSEDGVTDAEAAVGAHKSATLATSSWKALYTQELDRGDREQTVTQSHQVNHAESTSLNTVESSFGNQDTYTVGSDGWSSRTINNESQYAYVREGYNSTRAVHATMLTEFLGNVNYTQSEITTQDGDNYVTYTATGIPEDSTFQTNESGLENVSSEFIVAESGRITEFSLEANVTSADRPDSDVTIDLAFSDHGSTTVDEPDWLDEAKNQTSGSAPPEETETPTDDS